jgi:hypothetical protein
MQNTRGDGSGSASSLIKSSGNKMVLLTIASVILSVLIGLRALSPILHVAALFPFYYASMKQHRHSVTLVLAIRWTVALFVTILVVGAFVPSRTAASLPFSDSTVAALSSWLADSQSPPPADYPYLLWGMAVFLAGSVVSGGLIGLIVGSLALGSTAFGALFLFEHGTNVLVIALTAVPLWQWCLFAGGAFCLVPTALPFFERFLKIERVAEARYVLMTYLYIGAGFFLASLILRLAIAGLWHRLLQRVTVL